MNMILVIIIAVTVLISYKGFNDLSFFRKFEFHIGSIHQGEQIRMISSGFLHVDMGHLFFNMITLWFFAPLVLSYLGNWTFILIYMGSLIFGNLLTYVFNKNNYTYRAVGASGAVTGVLYSAILLQPDMMLGLFFVIPIPAYLFGILYLLYSIYGMKSQNDNIGHSAHFGGAVGGYIITLIEQPQLLVDHTMMVVLLTIPIIVLFIMQRLGKL
jgi:membrane associated rhomboid family serine protease